jgi:hypothetical protein
MRSTPRAVLHVQANPEKDSETRKPPFIGRPPPLKTTPQPDGQSESFSGSHLHLTITSTPQSCFMYWKGIEPSELLDYDSRLVAFTQELPF